MKIPIDPEDNKKERIRILNKARTNPELRALIMKKSQVDNTFWTDLFSWTLDPRIVPSNVPFILYPKQEELDDLLDNLLERSRNGEVVSLFIDKPRAVGVTVTLMNWITRHYLFDESFNALIGSRKEDYVDKTGNPDTLFYKIDYTLTRLPKWMLRGYNEKFHRASMSVRHPINNNTIDGESSNPNFGRGGRRSVIVMDELAFWEDARSAWSSCGESTNFRIAITTPPEEGKDSFCYKLRNGQAGKITVFDFDWRDVPSRDDKWLAERKESKSEEEFNREVMKSYDGTVEGKVYANDLSRTKIEKCEYDPRKPLYVTMDDGLDGTALIWLQKDFHTGQLFAIDCYQNFGKDISFYAPFFGYPVSSEYEYNDYDLEVIERHKYWGKATFFGDPSIKQTRNNTGESCRDVLQRKFGIWVECKDWNNRKWKDLRDLTKPTFRRLSIDPDMCEKLIYSLRNARYPKVKEAANTTQAPQKPIHDSTSHLRSAYEYFCDNEGDLTPYLDFQEEVKEEFDKFSVF